jgi:hypothetical protein
VAAGFSFIDRTRGQYTNCESRHILIFLPGVGTMRNKRKQFSDRRHGTAMPRAPFKDSHGMTIRERRRKIFDRRIHNIQAEWIEEIVIS